MVVVVVVLEGAERFYETVYYAVSMSAKGVHEGEDATCGEDEELVFDGLDEVFVVVRVFSYFRYQKMLAHVVVH